MDAASRCLALTGHLAEADDDHGCSLGQGGCAGTTGTNFRTALFDADRQVGYGSRGTYCQVTPIDKLALGKSVTSRATSVPLHSPMRITDGGLGNLDYYFGYPAEPTPIRLTIDLKTVQPVNQIVMHAFFNGNIYESYRVQVSKDGTTFTTVADRTARPADPGPTATHDFPGTEVRYVRIVTRGCKG